MWTSPDGITWSRVPHDEAVFGGEGSQLMWDVTTTGSLVVAVGSEQTHSDVDAAVWTSPDGITWSRVPHDEVVFGGEGEREMKSVTAASSGLVAVGSAGSLNDGIDAAVWTSADGISWSRVPHNEAVFGGEGFQLMASVSTGGPGVVAVGSDEFHAAVWVAAEDD